METITRASQYKKFGVVLSYFSFLALFFTGSAAQSQQTLTPQELAKYGETALQRIKELEYSITVIADKKRTEYDRNSALQNAVALFIPEAKMQVTSLRGSQTSVSTLAMSRYFARLKALTYKEVTIEYYDLCVVSDFVLGTDGRYHATATIYQKFTGVTAEGARYVDKTVKIVDIILEWAEDPFFKDKRWMIKFGDIKVNETLAA
jgi:hypothetical protein